MYACMYNVSYVPRTVVVQVVRAKCSQASSVQKFSGNTLKNYSLFTIRVEYRERGGFVTSRIDNTHRNVKEGSTINDGLKN